MKTKRFRLLTVLLTVVMMLALSVQVYAATSSPVTKDGITATLVTDKDSYAAGESINATVKVENNTGKDVFIFTEITVPSAVKLAGASAFDAVLQNGQSWTSAAGVLDGTAGSTATGDHLQAGLWSVLTILAIAGVVALLVYGKNRKTWVSMMLLVVMIGGLMAAAVPAQAAGVAGSMDLSCAIQLDGKAAEVSAIVQLSLHQARHLPQLQQRHQQRLRQRPRPRLQQRLRRKHQQRLRPKPQQRPRPRLRQRLQLKPQQRLLWCQRLRRKLPIM